MTIDPSISTTPFASITEVSCNKDRDDILFSMHTVFRICDIKPMGVNHRLFQVNLTLTSDADKDLCMLTDRIREETFPHSKGWYRLGLLLFKMGQSDRAQEIYDMLLDQTTDISEKASIYTQLGRIKYNLGEYKDAMTLYQKSLEINQKILPPNHPDLAACHDNIGLVYENIGNYSKACSFYGRALDIGQQSLPPNHPSLQQQQKNLDRVKKKL
jgi:tetratricopeptide (TPR) repeat protein